MHICAWSTAPFSFSQTCAASASNCSKLACSSGASVARKSFFQSIAALGQQLDQPGVAPELPADFVEVTLAVEQVEHPHQFGLAAEELERRIGAVIGRAEHDQPPAALAELVPGRAVIRHQRPRQQPAAGMRQQVHFAVAAQRFLHGRRQFSTSLLSDLRQS